MHAKGWARFFRFRSIQANIAFTFSVLIGISVLFVAMVAYQLAYSNAERSARANTRQLVSQVNRNIETYMDNMENVALMVQQNDEVLRFLMAGNTYDGAYQPTVISRFFRNIIESREDIASIALFRKDDRVISERGENDLNPWVSIAGQGWYENAKTQKARSTVLAPRVQNLFVHDNYRWVVSMTRTITRENAQPGVLLVDLNFRVIENLCRQIELGRRGYIFVVDANGDLVYHPQQQLLYSRIKTEDIGGIMQLSSGGDLTTVQEGGERLYTVAVSDKTGWRVVGVTMTDELVPEAATMQLSFFLWGAAFVLLGLTLAVIISRGISKPVRRLELSMMEVERGNFDTRADVDSPEEIAELGRAFNMMTATIRDLMAQNVQEQEQKRKSELKALQAQINPHFLYNTLDSIIWMAEGKNSEDVVTMASALAKLFRLSISKGEEIIPVVSELEHVRSYLTIQKMRYQDKLDFTISASPAARSMKTLKILLQPLVENAIYHGIKNKEGAGHINISATVEDGALILRVRDDGIGMSPDELALILEQKPSKSGTGSGVGVRNVHERIRLYFGNAYGLFFSSEQGFGTEVRVRLPVMEEETGEEDRA